MDPPAKHPAAADLDLDSFVDDSVWQFVKEKWDGIVRFYMHRKTLRPMCLSKGSSRHDLTFVGLIVFFRPPSMESTPVQNLKMECSPKSTPLVMKMVDNVYQAGVCLDISTRQETWDRFETAYDIEMTPRLISAPTKKRSRSPEASTKRKNRCPPPKEEEASLCVICLERPPNTTTSCAHTVVCQECSKELASHPEKHSSKHCVYCNQKLTAVYESNGEVRKIETVVLDE